MTPRIITAAERAARRGQPRPVGFLYKKNPDGTRCKTCRPVPIYARQPTQPGAITTQPSTTESHGQSI